MGAILRGVGVGELMVVTWLSMRSLTWSCRDLVLNMFTGVTGVYTPPWRFTVIGVGLVSSGIMWGTCWGIGLDARPGLIDILYGVTTLGDGV